MLQQAGQLVGFIGAFNVLSDTDSGFLVKAGLGSQHILGLSVEGIDLSVERSEKFDNSGFFDGQISGIFGMNIADQKFATVSDINGGNGIKKRIDFESGHIIGRSFATRQFSQDESFSGQSQSTYRGHSNGHLGGGQDVGGGAGDNGDGDKGIGDGGQGGDDGEDVLVHVCFEKKRGLKKIRINII